MSFSHQADLFSDTILVSKHTETAELKLELKPLGQTRVQVIAAWRKRHHDDSFKKIESYDGLELHLDELNLDESTIRQLSRD